jgi:hypothetical protein
MENISVPSVSSSNSSDRYKNTASSNSTSQILQEFQTLLMLSTLSSMDSGDSSSDLFGSTSSSLGSSSSMMGGMSSLLEQLMAMQVQGGSQSNLSSSLLSTYGSVLGKAPQINQFDGERQVGGDGANSNCGPTSLVMALHQQGLRAAGETTGTSSGKAIELARKSMAANASYDGVDAKGRRSEAEHNVYTDFEDLARGASAAGAKSNMITPTTTSIARALQTGRSVIVSGTFAGKSPLPWTGDRGSDSKSAPGGAAAHIVLVSGYNATTNSFTINDPARNNPIQVSAASLSRFMEGNDGAIAISK